MVKGSLFQICDLYLQMTKATVFLYYIIAYKALLQNFLNFSLDHKREKSVH